MTTTTTPDRTPWSTMMNIEEMERPNRMCFVPSEPYLKVIVRGKIYQLRKSVICHIPTLCNLLESISTLGGTIKPDEVIPIPDEYAPEHLEVAFGFAIAMARGRRVTMRTKETPRDAFVDLDGEYRIILSHCFDTREEFAFVQGVMLIANYLGMTELLDVCCRTMAIALRRHSSVQLLKLFNIEPPTEEQRCEIMKQYQFLNNL